MKPGADADRPPHRRASSLGALAAVLAAGRPRPAAAMRAGARHRSRRAWPSSRSRRCAPLPGPRRRAPLGVADEGPGSLLREGSRVLVDVRFDRCDRRAPAASCAQPGREVLAVSRRYQTVTVAVKPGRLPRARPGVAGVSRGRPRCWRRSLAPPPAAGRSSPRAIAQLQPPTARADFGVDGSGVTVGILSDSFDQRPSTARRPSAAARTSPAATCPGNGNPCGNTTPVDVLDDFDIDRAEEAHRRGAGDGADRPRPGAGRAIAFATAFNGELAFAEQHRRPRRGRGAG